MDIEFAFICEAADFGGRGPAAIGIGRRLVSRSATRLSGVGQLAFTGSEAGGSCEIEVAIVNPDGRDVDRGPLQRDLPPPPEGALLPIGHITFTGQFRGLRFTQAGPHAVQIATPYRLLATVPFEVV